jgi:3-oxoacyl-[acyl-carrier protein] reductase
VDLGLSGRLAVVTGGSQGLGYAAAEALVREGARVAITARTEGRLRVAEAKLRALGGDVYAAPSDVTDRARIEAFLTEVESECGAPDILVYNNSSARDLYLEEADDEDFVHALQTTILGLNWCVQALTPGMRTRGWGRIVTLGSLCAKEPHRDLPMVLHNLSRPAQLGFSKTLANTLGADGITVNTIGIGMIDHDGEAVSRSYRQHDRGLSEADIRELRTRNPLNRTGTAEELGSLVAFVCSDRAGFLTGQLVVLDGGRIGALY